MPKIHTVPVYSKLAVHTPSELVARMPDGWRLSQHQVDTYLALTASDGPDILFNTAMTGDGKSLGGQLPSLISGWKHTLFAMYPTNELIYDQLRQAKDTWASWGEPPSIIRLLNGPELDRLMTAKDYAQRGEALLSAMRNSEILLTNPDIFHYVMQTFYRRQGKKGDAPDKVIGPLIENFVQFTFDEFHIFESPQIVSVLNAILLIYEMMGQQRKRFLFQSATPNSVMQRYLERSGLSYQIIEGQYLHGAQTPPIGEWRQILQGSDINFSADRIDAWLDDHGEDILLAFFKENSPAAKGAVIVNSVAQAKRLVVRLRELMEPFGFSVGENTGLTSRTLRAQSYECDLLVGTSTVDIGVDFQINFLLFESRDSGSFLQRLGRLGRHTSYERGGKTINFNGKFEAHAFLPPWIIEALFDGRPEQPALLKDEMETDRQALINAVQDAFPPVADFAQYARYWGGFQSVRVIGELGQYVVKGQNARLRQQLADRYQKTFNINLTAQSGAYRALRNEQPVLLDEAISFRGNSYFTSGVLDMTERGADQIKTYDLFPLMASGELDQLDEIDFWKAVDVYGIQRKPLERPEPIAFFRLHGFRPDRLQYRIFLQHDLMEWDASRFGVAIAIQGISIDTEYAHEVPGLNAVNRTLERQTVPALLCMGHHPLDMKRRLRLPLLFALQNFISRDGAEGTIALGREALLLDVALKYRQIDCGGQAMIF